MKYHTDVGIPKNIKTKFGVLRLTYSAHAQHAAHTDKYFEVIMLPNELDTNAAQVIEVETDGFNPLKVVYRIPYDTTYDLVLVVLPTKRFVKTVWLNARTDKHATLDTTKYAIA